MDRKIAWQGLYPTLIENATLVSALVGSEQLSLEYSNLATGLLLSYLPGRVCLSPSLNLCRFSLSLFVNESKV